MGDGITFPTRLPVDCTTYHSIGCDHKLCKLSLIENLVGNTLPTRPDTPNRTLINPVMGGGGQVAVTESTRAQSTVPSCTVTSRSETVSGLSGSMSPDYRTPHSPDCKITITPDSGVTMMEKVTMMSEVRLDNNGHTKTVMVADSDSTNEQNMISR